MKRDLEKRVLKRLNQINQRKRRYNFTISPNVKIAFAAWCQEQGFKESSAIEALLIEMIPQKYLK